MIEHFVLYCRDRSCTDKGLYFVDVLKFSILFRTRKRCKYYSAVKNSIYNDIKGTGQFW